MLLKYTDQYPDVISLRESIKALKAREKQETADAKHGDLGAASSLGLAASPVYMHLQEEYNSEVVEIASLQQQIPTGSSASQASSRRWARRQGCRRNSRS